MATNASSLSIHQKHQVNMKREPDMLQIHEKESEEGSNKEIPSERPKLIFKQIKQQVSQKVLKRYEDPSISDLEISMLKITEQSVHENHEEIHKERKIDFDRDEVLKVEKKESDDMVLVENDSEKQTFLYGRM